MLQLGHLAGFVRDATAVGEVSVDGVNYAPEPSVSAQLLFTNSGSVAVTR